MRIGIVTQPLCANYGGILQNLALQKVLKDMGHTPITLDLCTHLNISKAEYIKGYLINLMKCFVKRRRIKYLSYNQKRPEFFDQFVSEYIYTTEEIKEYSSFIIDKYELDCLIVGSDQVWRPRFNVFPEDMFLRFAVGKEIKRLSYAASFGVDNWEYSDYLTRVCRDLSSAFDGISVREESGVLLCKKYLRQDSVAVLDPTLLLGQDYYNSLCKDVKKQNEKFIAVYTLNLTDGIKKQIDTFASESGYKIRLFTSDANHTLTVPEWISVFRDALFVITDSFHGTAFSIIYNKNFISISNDSRGASRFNSLLRVFGLENRFVVDGSLDSSILKKEIDWKEVNERREIMVNKSLLFLHNRLQ